MCERSAVTDQTSYELNRASWDERAPAHAASPDYGFARFATDLEHLSSTVAIRPPAPRRIDEEQTGALVVDYPYFERPEPLEFDDPTTYVETDLVFEVNRTHSWNHGLGEIITAVLDAGLQVTAFEEHDSVPWVALPGQMEPIGGGEHRLADRPWRLPHSYTLQAVKR